MNAVVLFALPAVLVAAVCEVGAAMTQGDGNVSGQELDIFHITDELDDIYAYYATDMRMALHLHDQLRATPVVNAMRDRQ